jgi:hypothetical protein
MLVTDYADNGLSGSPVLNLDGKLIGMVKGGDTWQTVHQVATIPTHMIHSVLSGAGIPNIVS